MDQRNYPGHNVEGVDSNHGAVLDLLGAALDRDIHIERQADACRSQTVNIGLRYDRKRIAKCFRERLFRFDETGWDQTVCLSLSVLRSRRRYDVNSRADHVELDYGRFSWQTKRACRQREAQQASGNCADRTGIAQRIERHYTRVVHAGAPASVSRGLIVLRHTLTHPDFRREFELRLRDTQ